MSCGLWVRVCWPHGGFISHSRFMLLQAELGLCLVSSSRWYPGDNLASWCSCGRQIGERAEPHVTLKRALGSGKSHLRWHCPGQSYSCCRVCLQLDGKYTKCPTNTDPVGRNRMQFSCKCVANSGSFAYLWTTQLWWVRTAHCITIQHVTSDCANKWTVRSLDLSFWSQNTNCFPLYSLNA